MAVSTDARVGPDPRRTAQVLLIFGVLLAVTMFVAPCAIIAVTALFETVFTAV